MKLLNSVLTLSLFVLYLCEPKAQPVSAAFGSHENEIPEKVVTTAGGGFAAINMTQATLSEFAGGDGSQQNPWLIATPNHLDNVRNYLGAAHADKHFLQIDDINLGVPPWNAGEGWLPIGSSAARFTGNYNGDGHIISGLYMNRPGMGSLGMWGFIGDGGVVQNVVLADVQVTGGAQIVGTLAGTNRGTISNSSVTGVVSGGYRVGGMVGENNPGTVEYCFANVTVLANNGRIGGLVGFNVGGTVYQSYATANVSGGWYVGGVVGRNLQGTMQQCYATGNINGSNSVGGLVGDTEGGSISNSYAMGNASGGFAVGGLIGYVWQTAVSNCYSTGSVGGGSFDHGGLIGYRFGGTVLNSYWNTETSGQSASAGGQGRTTAQLLDQANFVNWNFNETWGIHQGLSYPWLQWQGAAGGHNYPYGLSGDSNCDGIVNVLDAITTVNYVMGNNPQPFCFENADINQDGIVNVLDVIATVNLILGE
jgi:hypothetical protein